MGISSLGSIPYDFMVEAMGIEPMSESIFTGVSPSAAFVLKFRLGQRPKAGYALCYPVSPSCCRAFTRGFPACLTHDSEPAGEPGHARGAELSS